MKDITNKQFKISLIPSKDTQAIVVIAFDFPDLSNTLMHKVKCSNACVCNEETTGNVHSVVVAFCVLAQLKYDLKNSFVNTRKNKVYSVKANALDSQLVVSIATQNSGTAINKVIGVCVRSFARISYSNYSYLMYRMNAKPETSAYNYYFNKLIDSISKKVEVVVIGKEKLSDVLAKFGETATSKISVPSKKEPEKKPTVSAENMENFKVLDVEPTMSFILRNYIKNRAGVGMILNGGSSVVIDSLLVKKIKSATDSDKIDQYVKKLKAVKDLETVYVYSAGMCAQASPSTLNKMFKGIDTASVKKSITSSLSSI